MLPDKGSLSGLVLSLRSMDFDLVVFMVLDVVFLSRPFRSLIVFF